MSVPNIFPIPTVDDRVAIAAFMRAHLQIPLFPKLTTVVGPPAMQAPEEVGTALFCKRFVTVENFVHNRFSVTPREPSNE